MAAQPLIGRDAELAALAAAIDGDRTAVIVGEAGIGKTALARAAVDAAGRSLREGGAFATLRAAPYLALRRATRERLTGDPASVAGLVEQRVGPDVLFLDDLQWADEQTLATLPLLVGRVDIVACVRSLDVGSDHVLALLGELGVVRVEVAPLSADEARALVRARRPGLAPTVVEGIVSRAAGNPLLIEEMAERGEASPVIARILTGRLELLSPAARDAAAVLAVAEHPLPRAAVGAAVDEAIAVGIVQEREGRVAIRHQLVEAALRDALAPDELARLHERIAAIVQSRAAAARHLALAGHGDQAAAMALEAARESTDARERAALLVVAADARPEGSAALRLEAARALDEVADWATADRVLADLGSGASPEEVVEAHAIRAHAAYASRDVAACRSHVAAAAAVDVPADSDAAVRRAIEAATMLVNLDGDVPGALAALAAANAAVQPDSLAASDIRVLRESILLLATGKGDAAVIRRAADDAFDRGRYRTATDRSRIIQYLLLFGVGSEPTLEFLLERYERYERAGIESEALDFLADAAMAAVLAGRFERAIELADSLLEQPAPPRAREGGEIFRARASTYLGRLDEAEIALEALQPTVTRDYFGLGRILQARADLAWWGGKPALAVELANAALAVPAPLPLAHVDTLLTRAWATRELGGDPAPLPEMRHVPSTLGAVSEVAGLRALHAGDASTAAVEFEKAANAAMPFNALRGYLCRWAAADAARQAGAPGSTDALTALLGDAERSSFEPIAARARRSLRLAGVRVPAAARPTRAGARLTPREEELVRLVARGLTNVEIARRLGLGRPTVARILASAMAKVGVSRRTGLVGAAGT